MVAPVGHGFDEPQGGELVVELGHGFDEPHGLLLVGVRLFAMAR